MGDYKGVLHSLLDRCTDAHRKDIHDVTWGHLNENKLGRKSDDVIKRKFWDSANKDPVWLRKKVILKEQGSNVRNQLPPLQKNISAKDVVVDVRVLPARSNTKTDTRKKSNKRPGTSLPKLPRKSDKEDIFYPEMMIPSGKEGCPFSLDFIPNHQLLATKSEQYEQFRKTRKALLSEENHQSEQEKAVQRIHEKMERRLSKLADDTNNAPGPNYFRFKVYSDAWDELVGVMGHEGAAGLRGVKREYDSYVNTLLAEKVEHLKQKPGGGGVVVDYKRELAERKGLADEVKEEETRLKHLEDELMKELKENETLRAKVKEMTSMQGRQSPFSSLVNFENDDDEAESQHSPATATTKSEKHHVVDDLESQVLKLHEQIEEHFCQLEKIRRAQREDYVPLPVCQRLEQCVKEIEVDTQKLTKQNDFLEQEIQDLEQELEHILVNTGVKEKDVRKLWHRVSLSRVIDW